MVEILNCTSFNKFDVYGHVVSLPLRIRKTEANNVVDVENKICYPQVVVLGTFGLR